MKITPKLLSIPPYISTLWENVKSLQTKEGEEGDILTVFLQNETEIQIPGLNKEEIEEIFEAHARSIEKGTLKNFFNHPFSFTVPFKTGGTLETLANPMEHNPEQAKMAPIPPDVLKKIGAIVQAFGLDTHSPFSNPEPECNCVYCQIARSLQKNGEELESQGEVAPEDLTFRDWEIKQTADQLYSVTNPIDPNEHYTVFLGTPIGCNCGLKDCEHIRAVLRS